jgi:hypothetical protein
LLPFARNLRVHEHGRRIPGLDRENDHRLYDARLDQALDLDVIETEQVAEDFLIVLAGQGRR